MQKKQVVVSQAFMLAMQNIFLLVSIINVPLKIDELQQIDLEVGQCIDIYCTWNITLICYNIDHNIQYCTINLKELYNSTIFVSIKYFEMVREKMVSK